MAIEEGKSGLGLKLQVEASEIIDNYTILARLGVSRYKFWSDKLGGEEELLERIQIVGIGNKNKEEFMAELIDNEISVSDLARRMIAKLKIDKKQKVESVITIRLTAKELGFNEAFEVSDLVVEAAKYHLGHCPPETALYLRLNDRNQTKDDSYNIWMRPIVTDSWRSCIFNVGRHLYAKYKLSLDANGANNNMLFKPYMDFVFRFPGKNQRPENFWKSPFE
ncbi:MAG: hypothetical protein NTW50_05490 [Candidatus Berkelbacteria bacterium]|nr:hypothetical protein [Candidatus Berkelbacteria bacterium]